MKENDLENDLENNIQVVIDDIINARITYAEMGLSYDKLLKYIPAERYHGASHILLSQIYEIETKLRSECAGYEEDEVDKELVKARENLQYLIAYNVAMAAGYQIDFSKLKEKRNVKDLGAFIASVRNMLPKRITVKNTKHPCYGLTISEEDKEKYADIPTEWRESKVRGEIRTTKARILMLEMRKLEFIKERGEQNNSPIDMIEVGEALGGKKSNTTVGRTVVSNVTWSIESLRKVQALIGSVVPQEGPIELSGVVPTYVLSTITNALAGREVNIISHVGRKVAIPKLSQGRLNSQGNIKFEETQKGDSVLIKYSVPEATKVTIGNVPKVPEGSFVYVEGNGPGYLTAAIAGAYAPTCTNVSVLQKGQGYVCISTKNRLKKIGDITKNPIGESKNREPKMQDEEIK